MAIVIYRSSLTDEDELKVIKKHFNASNSMYCITNQLVIGRYSCVPFYDEVCRGLAISGSKLINSLSEHNYIANFAYYHDIEEYTPKTWFRLQDIPMNEPGPFVVKGVTNSKKHEWDKMMFAPTRQDAIRIAMDLKNDGLIGSQEIIVRKYVPLVRLGTGTHGLPFTNEWRLFYYKDQLLSAGFYWAESGLKGEMDLEGMELADNVADVVSKHTNFYTIDIAETEAGGWIVVEINEGSMAGLSCNLADDVWGNLKKELDKI